MFVNTISKVILQEMLYNNRRITNGVLTYQQKKGLGDFSLVVTAGRKECKERVLCDPSVVRFKVIK